MHANKPETVDTGSKCNKSRGKSVRAKHTGIYFTGRAGTYGTRGPAVDAGRLAGGRFRGRRFRETVKSGEEGGL